MFNSKYLCYAFCWLMNDMKQIYKNDPSFRMGSNLATWKIKQGINVQNVATFIYAAICSNIDSIELESWHVIHLFLVCVHKIIVKAIDMMAYYVPRFIQFNIIKILLRIITRQPNITGLWERGEARASVLFHPPHWYYLSLHSPWKPCKWPFPFPFD